MAGESAMFTCFTVAVLMYRIQYAFARINDPSVSPSPSQGGRD